MPFVAVLSKTGFSNYWFRFRFSNWFNRTMPGWVQFDIETWDNVFTGVCNLKNHENSPIIPVMCVLLLHCSHPDVLEFTTYMLRIIEIGRVLHWWIWCLLDIVFNLEICSIALMNIGSTWHWQGQDVATVQPVVLLLCCYECDITQCHYDVTRLDT